MLTRTFSQANLGKMAIRQYSSLNASAFCITARAARVLHVSLTSEKTEKCTVSSLLASSMIENLQRQGKQRAHLLYKIVHSAYIVQHVEGCICEKRVPAGWQEFQILNICMQETNYHPYVLCQPLLSLSHHGVYSALHLPSSLSLPSSPPGVSSALHLLSSLTLSSSPPGVSSALHLPSSLSLPSSPPGVSSALHLLYSPSNPSSTFRDLLCSAFTLHPTLHLPSRVSSAFNLFSNPSPTFRDLLCSAFTLLSYPPPTSRGLLCSAF
jgi:hypothetical protein